VNHVRRLGLIVTLCALAAFAFPYSAFAVGPVLTPETILTEGFESPVPVNYTTTPGTVGGADYWATWTYRQHGGLRSLWCDGTNATAATNHRYAQLSQGDASFPLPQAANYYKPIATFYYLLPSRGTDDVVSFAPQWTSDAQASTSWASAAGSIAYPVPSWTPLTVDLSQYFSGQTGESLSRNAGTFRLRWTDVVEADPYGTKIYVGEGPSVDDLTISGWMFGPISSVTATTTSVSTTLTWARPQASTRGTGVEDRAIAFRVWRAPKSTTSWTELTSPASRPATTGATYSFTDATVTDGAAYTYAVQTWAAGQSSETTGYGESTSVDATTKPFPPPAIAISSPASGAVLVSTGAATVSGSAAGIDGATLSAMSMKVVRSSDGRYFDRNTNSWVVPLTWNTVTPSASWTTTWMPTANDYHANTYTITTSVTDSRSKTASASVAVQVDSVPQVAPVAAITSPSVDATVATTGTFTMTGSATVQTGLPNATAEVSIQHGATWWNGSAWTGVQTWVPATVTGSSWSLSGIQPPANEFGTPTYTATARARDAHALTGTSSARTFTVDSVPRVAPTATITTPTTGSDLVGAGPFTVTGTAATTHPNLPLTGVRLSIARDDGTWWNGTSWVGSAASVSVVGTSTWSYSWTPPASEYLAHTYTLRATATDAHGLTGNSANSAVRVDTVPFVAPVATITSPSAGAVLTTTGTITMTGSATVQTGLPAATVEISIAHGATWWNGSAWVDVQAWVPASVSGSTWSLSGIKPPANEYLTPGYSATARARDAHALTGTSSARLFTVDSVPFTAPTAIVTVPVNGSDMLGAGPYILHGTAAAVHPNLPLTGVKLTIARDDGTWWNGTTWVGSAATVSVVGTSTWSYSWTPPSLEYLTHHYTIHATATDTHGLSGDSANSTVRIDSTVPNPPDVAFTYPAASVIASLSPVTLSGTAVPRADGATVTAVAVHIGRGSSAVGAPTSWWNGTTWTAAETPDTYLAAPGYVAGAASWSYPWQAPTNEYLANWYTVQAFARDLHSQTGTSAPVIVQLDSVPRVAPTATITTPTTGSDLVGAGPFTVTGTAATTHPNLPLTGVRLSIARDDGTWWNGTSWVGSAASVSVVGTSTWSYSWTPPASEYLAHTYTLRATATDAHGLTGNSANSAVRVDTVPFVAPVATITSPSAGAVLTTTGTITMTGSATVQTGLPAATVEISIAHGATWWNGSAWVDVQAWVPATVAGAGWSLSGIQPPANVYLDPAFSATARARDAHALTGTSSVTTFSVDSVPMTSLGTTITPLGHGEPAQAFGAGPITVAGVASSVAPMKSVRVTIVASRSPLAPQYWNGTAFVPAITSVTPAGLASWSTSFTPLPGDDHRWTYTLTSKVTDARNATASSADVVVYADTVAPHITSARSIGRYGIEVRFNEPPLVSQSKVALSAETTQCFAVRGIRLRRGAWFADGTRVRFTTSRQATTSGPVKVVQLLPIQDQAGNIRP